MLQIEDIRVSYGPAEILNGISAALPMGALTALIGPNGTGKSTLLKAVAGLIPASGRIALNGQRPGQGAVAYMPQDTSNKSALTVLEVILLGRVHSLALRLDPAQVDEAAELLAAFNLEALRDRTLDRLSGGQRQMVFLLQSLFRRPEVLLLDEPTAALDLNHQLFVLDTIRDYCRKHDIVAVAAVHDLTLAARFSDRILCLNGGRLHADGTPDDVLTCDMIRAVYNVEAEVLRSGAGHLSVIPLSARAA